MERPLIIAAISYLAGLVFGEGFTYFPLSLMFIFVTGLLAAYALHRNGGRSAGLILLVFILVCSGVIRMQWSSRLRPPDDIGQFATKQKAEVTGLIRSPLQHGKEKTVLILEARSVKPEVGGNVRTVDVRGRLRVTIRNFIPDLQYGDQILVIGKLRPVSGLHNPGGFDYGAYLKRNGIRGLVSVRKPESLVKIESGGFSPLRRIYEWRDSIRQALDQSLLPVPAAILQAMLIGETLSLSPDVREAFTHSGTAHLLSISGTHLAMVAWMVFNISCGFLRCLPGRWLLRLSRRITVSRLSVLVTIGPVVLYTLLAGGRVPTLRALIMVLIALGVIWWQRSNDPLNGLAIAAFVTLLWNPQAAFSVSFQLSYVTVLALILFAWKDSPGRGPGDPRSERISRPRVWIEWGYERARILVWISVVAGLATLPLTAYHFNQVAWVGFMANLIVVPWVGALVIPVGLVSAAGAILFQQTTLPLAGLNNLITGGLFTVVEVFSRIPGSELRVPSPPLIVVVAVYLAVLLATLHGAGAMKRFLIISCLLIVLSWGFRFFMSHPGDSLRITFLDVGQGDAAWIVMPGGKTMLIDGGLAYGRFDLGRLVVAPYLWNTGHWKINTIVVSHPQLDHMGGLSYIARKFDVDEIWTNGRKKDALFYDRFQDVVSMRGIPEKRVSADGTPLIHEGALRVQVLHPEPFSGLQSGSSGPAGSRSSSADNNQSLVILVQYGKEGVLFTGDIEGQAERDLLRWGPLLRATVLKVPHHGSRSSIDAGFLRQVHPSVAIISVGGNNPYGHPFPETLAAYEALGAKIYRTDEDGAVLLETDGSRWIIRTYRDIVIRSVHWGPEMIRSELSNLKRTWYRYWVGLA